MFHSSLKTGVVLAFANFAIVGSALAAGSPLPITKDAASLFIPTQDQENQEIWRDLQTSQTPPPAAVGQAQSKEDCEKAGGQWDANNNRCAEKK